MNTVTTNLLKIKNEITTIAQKCERDPNEIQLIAVSKTKPVSMIEEAIKAGQRSFGENYVQEGVDKIVYFKEKKPTQPIIWHFIGPLQSNKTKLVAENFNWVHTIDRYKIAKRLNDQRPTDQQKLNVLIQINISGENTKSGIDPNQLLDLADQINTLPNLTLRGLMAIPEIECNFEHQLETFNKMRELQHLLQEKYDGIDTLSMGMSNDMESAIQAGSTMVRIGSAIFGARQYL